MQKAVDDENKVKIWKDAADSYRYVEHYEMQIDCLEKSLAIIILVLNQYEFSRFDGDYWFSMVDLIRAYIQVGNFEKAKYNIDNLYKNAIEFYKSIGNSDNSWERIWNMESIAEFYSECALKEKAVNTYLAAMYIGLEKDSNQYEILKDRDMKINICKISESINCLLEGEIENNIIDKVIDLKDTLVCYRDDYLGDKNTYDEIISKINDHYQNQEIEFKK